MKNFRYIIIFLLFTFVKSVCAQNNDTIKTAKDAYIKTDETKKYVKIDSLTSDLTKKENSETKKSPRTAALLSTFIPGAGQVYNKKYWKVPIIYGGFIGFYLLSEYNNERYKELLYNYKIKSGTDTINKLDPKYKDADKDQMLYYKDRYRRDRDLNYILIGLVYVLNIVDATVDVHLSDYDVNEDLSLRIDPVLIPDYGFIAKQNVNPYMGLQLSLKFNQNNKKKNQKFYLW